MLAARIALFGLGCSRLGLEVQLMQRGGRRQPMLWIEREQPIQQIKRANHPLAANPHRFVPWRSLVRRRAEQSVQALRTAGAA